MDKDLYKKGMDVRRKVLGDKHIARRQESPDRFTKQQDELVTELAWAQIWSRPQLPLKLRSLVTIAMLAALNRADELKGHVNGALNNGATPERSSRSLFRVPLTWDSPHRTRPCAWP